MAEAKKKTKKTKAEKAAEAKAKKAAEAKAKREANKARKAKRKAKVEKINAKQKRKRDPKRKGKKWTLELTHGGVSYSCGPFATEAEAIEYEKLTSAADLDADGLPD